MKDSSFFTASHTKATGSMGQFMSKMNKSPAKWINESTWKECLQLSSSISAFAGLCSNIAVNGSFWSKFSTCENPFQYLEDLSSAVEGTNLKSSLVSYQTQCHTMLEKFFLPKGLQVTVRVLGFIGRIARNTSV